MSEKEADLILSGLDKRLFLEQLTHLLKYKCLLSEDEILSLYAPSRSDKEIAIPLTAFANEQLSALETICRYLKQDCSMRYSEIGGIINRDQRTIWVTYSNSLKKRAEPLNPLPSDISIPVSIFKGRELSVLESLVFYLKSTHNLRYSEIAARINRDERNVWTIYSKAEKKLAKARVSPAIGGEL